MKVITFPPTTHLGMELMKKKVCTDVNAFVAFFKDTVLDFKTDVHTLFKRTDVDSYIHILSEICELVSLSK